MTEGYSVSKYDEAMGSRDEEQRQPLNPPPAYSAAVTPYPAAVTPYPAAVTPYPAAANAPPVTSAGGAHVQYLPVDADGKVTVGTGQRQVQVMVAPNQQVIVREAEVIPDNTGAIVASCLVIWCCCWPIGLAAFVVAVTRSKTDATSAKKQIRLANYLSVAGIICGVIIIGLYLMVEMKRT